MTSPTDTFVRGILDDSPSPNDGSALSRQLISASESMRTIPDSPNSRTRLLEKSDDSPLLPRRSNQRSMRRAQSLFRYSLIFINFTFIVAAMLLIMAGVVARENSAVKLCNHCSDLTLVAIVFGVALWLFAIFGFNWIRQRNILLLLVYVAFLAVQSVVLFAVIITAGVFDANAANAGDDETPFLLQWEESVNATNGETESPLCDLQRQFNCSGYRYGCCLAGVCYNATHPESWVGAVCPVCNATAAPQVCTDIVYNTLRKNLGGFLVISCFSMLLVLSGILLAFLARKVNQSVARSSAPTQSS